MTVVSRILLVVALLALVQACSWKIVPTDPNDGTQVPTFGKGGGS